ncbi:MAG: hypothetical protein AB7E79_16580 [Rhodospirillaceae bacterium]
MSEDDHVTVDPGLRAAVVRSFEVWVGAHKVAKPKGRHVVRYCADMWVKGTFPGHLGIPTVWGILHAAGAFTPRHRRSPEQ